YFVPGASLSSVTDEEIRLERSRTRVEHWRRWGPYLSERAGGTVPENYRPPGTAWEFLPHDHARSKAYRWNEDGLAGICDRQDVKECYYYLDSTPTHSCMRYLYRHPQTESCYFDVEVKYAKESPEDILIRIHTTNHGPERAEFHLLPTIWFRKA